ncbi:MAG: hypothetical protein FJ100_16235 [Deltaproteobacteria bacterium]|nr:hypothetical protein [Deltaproteobacteria bacterium]
MPFDALTGDAAAIGREPGEVIEPGDTNAPSLTPQQIATLAEEFYNKSSQIYTIFRQCSEAINGFRASRFAIGTVSNTTSVETYLRPRDVCISLILPLFRNVVARFSTEMPSAGVVPADDSPLEIQRAQASEQALRYAWRDAKMRRVMTEFIEWLALHGTGGLLVCMDRGNVRVNAVCAEDLRAEPGVEPGDSRFLGVVRRTTREALRAQFPDKWQQIESAPAARIPLSQSLFLTAQPAPDRVEVLEAYCASGHWYIMTSDGNVLDQGETPGKTMPLSVVRYTRLPGEFHGMGMVEPALDPQYAFNTIVNQTLRNARSMANPKVLIERSSKVDPSAFTTRVGEKVFYSGQPPTVWTPPPMPQYFTMLPPQLQAHVHDMTGVHTTSLGKRAVGISSGRAIEALTANDLAQFQGTQDAIEDAVRHVARSMLLYMRAFYPPDKVLRMFNGTGKSILSTLRATDIAEDPDVFFEAGTLFSAEVKDRDQRTLDLIRLGMMTPEEGRRALSFRLDPMAPVQTIADMAHAQKILKQVVETPTGPGGIAGVEVYPSDNLKALDEVVGGFMRSDEWDGLDPAVQERVAQLYKQIIALKNPAPTLDPSQAPKPPGAPQEPIGSLLPGVQDLSAPADEELDKAEAGGQALTGGV